jgi:hypothetical protein
LHSQKPLQFAFAADLIVRRREGAAMKYALAACLLLSAATAGAEESDEGSIPEPTELSILASDAMNEMAVAGSPISIESEESNASLTVVEVLAADGHEARGVRLSLQNASQEDELYLDSNQLAQVLDEFVGLKQWYERNETCGAQKRCVHGIARCRPSQTVRQAFCPGFYSTPDGERGVLVSTPRNSFLFPSVEPSVFASAISATIGDRN